jgi:hypothetical protein
VPTLLLRRARTALPVRPHLPHLRRPAAAPEPVRSSARLLLAPAQRCLDPLCSSCTACLRRASSAPALTRSHSSPEPRAPARPHPACLHSGRSPSNRAAWALTAQRPRLALPTTPCTAARACPDLPLPAGAA